MPGRCEIQASLLFAIIADGLHGAALQGLHTHTYFFFGRRLFMDVRIASLVMTGKKSRGGFSAQIAVDTLLIDEEFTGSIWSPLISFVCHRSHPIR